MKNINIAIIGGGPVGIYFASILEKKGINYSLFEGEGQLGGQPLSLYPEKEMLDVPGYEKLLAKDLIKKMTASLNMSHVFLSSPVSDLKEDKDGVTLTSNGKTYHFDDAIIATGLGYHKPRPMGIEDEDKCVNILYSLKDPSSLKGQRVAIFGGGDSALDWARALSCISAVSLIHRRTEFRGDPSSIKGCAIHIYLPYIPAKLHRVGNKATSIEIENVADKTRIDLPVDTILVNYGQIPTPSTFGYPLTTTGFGLVHQEHYQIAPHIYACGDCLFDTEKKKRIAPAMEEVDEILKALI
jgi:thioredoxin reductase (NADPH)